jgi:hypothetical protein
LETENRKIKDIVKFVGTGQTDQGEEIVIEFDASLVEIRKEYSDYLPSTPTLLIIPKYNEETKEFISVSVRKPVRKKLSFEEYTEGELFEKAFEQVLAHLLIENRVPYENVDILRNKIELPFNNEELLGLYLFKEELNNDLSAYSEHFGMELISTGTVLMNNLKKIHERVNSRLNRSYSEYEEKFIRNIK